MIFQFNLNNHNHMRRLKAVTLIKACGIEKKEGCATRDHLVHFGYVNVTAFQVRIRENNRSTKSWSSSCSYSRIIRQKQLQLSICIQNFYFFIPNLLRILWEILLLRTCSGVVTKIQGTLLRSESFKILRWGRWENHQECQVVWQKHNITTNQRDEAKNGANG